MFPEGQFNEQTILTLLALGITVATIYSCAANRLAQEVFLFIVPTALDVKLLYEGQSSHLWLAILVAGTAAFCFLQAGRLRHEVLRALDDKLAQNNLLSFLCHEKSKVQRLNEKLRNQVLECRSMEQKLIISEARWRQTVQNSPNVILTLDNQGRISSWNPACEEKLGYSGAELNGSKLEMVVIPDTEATAIPHVLEKVFKGKSMNSLELKFKSKDGSSIRMLSRAYPITDSDGRVVECTLANTDVTEKMVGEERIRKALEEKTILFREIHHRVKNNLQLMSSLLALQSEYLNNEDVAAACHDSQRRIWAMALVHEALYRSENFSNLEAGHYFACLVQEISASMRGENRQVIVHMDVENLELKMDTAVNCGLIINELLANAFRHAFPVQSEGEVRISFHCKGGNRAELVVSDNGIGMDYDLEISTPRTFGLDLVKMLCEEMRADFQIYASEGTTARLEFELPEPGKR